MSDRPGASSISHALRAMVHPLPIVLAAGTVIAGLISVILAIPLAAAWLASVIVIAHRRASRTRQPDISHLPPSIQADLLDVTAALDRLQSAARSVPPQQRPMFEGIEREADEVREAVLQLGIAAGALHRHLEATPPGQIEEELADLRARSDATKDEVSRGGIDASIAEREGRLERRERLLGRLERYRATLKSLEATARELADRAVDLAAGAPMEYDVLDEQSPERKISEMKASVAALEQVLRADTEII